jgi:exodeoxyribonuclease VII large subunit
VISSATAAGFGDFVNQIENNAYGYAVRLKLYNSLMQGNEAVGSLLTAFAKVESDLPSASWDAVVLIRGGGAQLDLDCFDDYNLAARISRFPIPVFTGIGHERDETIADLVAHTKLKTPTAVAEFLLAGFREFEENLGLVVRRMDRLSRTRLREEEIKIQQFALRTKSVAKQRVSKESDKINTRVKQIEQSVKVICRQNSNHLDLLEKNLHKTFQRFLKNQKEKLDGIEISVNQLDPFSLLKKGYTRTESQGKPIHLVSLNPGEILTTHTLNQKINSTVTKIEEK